MSEEYSAFSAIQLRFAGLPGQNKLPQRYRQSLVSNTLDTQVCNRSKHGISSTMFERLQDMASAMLWIKKELVCSFIVICNCFKMFILML